MPDDKVLVSGCQQPKNRAIQHQKNKAIEK
jgi:hypothetical protein